MNVFYCPEIINEKAILSPEESGHCIRVLRMGRGEKVQVIDGVGGYFSAVIIDPDPRCCILEIQEPIDHEKSRNFRIHIAIAPTKNTERFEWFVEKSVEIGIDIITPLLCQRSERKILKTDRLQKLIVSSMKQAVIPFRPVLQELTALKNFPGSPDIPEQNRFIAHCAETGRQKLQDVCKPGRDAVVLIGPEGDFTDEEIAFAMKHRFVPVTLGKNRLRTETAGLVACQTLNLLNDLTTCLPGLGPGVGRQV